MINTNNSGCYRSLDCLHPIHNDSENIFSNEAILLTLYRLSPWEEVLGPFIDLKQNSEGFFEALIGRVRVALPEEIGSKLQGLQGQRIGILRTDVDYRMRIINS
jgi:hypothetical protein